MFVKEFFFSFSLLAFTAILMIVGGLLLLDALRRLVVEAYKTMRPKANKPAVAAPLAIPKKSEEKRPIFKVAA